jgi:predicted TIM-barrel fold metal-dependent hydrolase
MFQDLSFADPRVIDLLGALAGEGMTVIAHVGEAGEGAGDRAAPRHVRAALDQIPDLTLITCHFGGYHRLDEAEEFLVGSRAVLETSWPPRLSDLDAGRLRRIIDRHGADRVVFGSDWPMADPATEISAVRSLGLDAASEQAILGGNLARLLGLDRHDR